MGKVPKKTFQPAIAVNRRWGKPSANLSANRNNQLVCNRMENILVITYFWHTEGINKRIIVCVERLRDAYQHDNPYSGFGGGGGVACVDRLTLD